MIFRKNRSKEPNRIPSYANYVVQKVAPNLAAQRDVIISTAEKSFPQGVYEKGAERALVRYGHATSQVISLAFAAAVRDARGSELLDIEYGDCALAASFIMRSPLRNLDEATDEIIIEWLTCFEDDMRYLVFANDETFADLTEAGNDRFLYYEDNPNSKLPDAYLHLLAQVLRQRKGGEWEPYRLLDPMMLGVPIVFAALSTALSEVEVMFDEWVGTVNEVQKIADKNELEVWSWW